MDLRVLGWGDNVVDKYINRGIMYPGGNALNFAVYAKMLGANSAYLGVFGNDDEADYIKHVLHELGVKTDFCRTEQGENGYARVVLENNNRVFLGSNKGGISAEKPVILDERDLEYIKDFDLVCTSINSHLDREIPKLKNIGAAVAYDFSVKGTPNLYRKLCEHIEFGIISCGDMTVEEMKLEIEKLHGFGARYVLATRGEHGSHFSDGSQVYYQEAYRVKAKDTLGAGDSYLTAFLLNYLSFKKKYYGKGEVPKEEREKGIRHSMDAAAKFAAKNCMIDGAFGFAREYSK